MDDQLHDQFSEIGADHWWFEGRRVIVRAVLDELLNPTADHASRLILDAGCGAGTMLGILLRYGAVHGIDASELSVKACRLTYGDTVTVSQGLIPDDLPTVPSFDMIGAFDVIEHLDDDTEAVARMRNALHPGGLLVCTVPAFMFLWGQQDVLSHHRRRYRAEALRMLLEESGFQVERLTYFNTLLFPFVAAIRLWRRLPLNKTRQPRSDFDVTPAWANSALGKLFSIERLAVRRWSLPIGVSLLVVARKRG